MSREKGVSSDDNPMIGSSADMAAPRRSYDDHSFVLQAIMDLQKTVGSLTSKVDRLIDDVSSHGNKIDRLRLTLAWAGGIAVAVMFFLSIAARIIPIPHVTFDVTTPAHDTAK